MAPEIELQGCHLNDDVIQKGSDLSGTIVWDNISGYSGDAFLFIDISSTFGLLKTPVTFTGARVESHEFSVDTSGLDLDDANSVWVRLEIDGEEVVRTAGCGMFSAIEGGGDMGNLDFLFIASGIAGIAYAIHRRSRQ